MKTETIILILIVVLVLSYLYLNTEKFTQKLVNNNIEKNLLGSFSDITGNYILDKTPISTFG